MQRTKRTYLWRSDTIHSAILHGKSDVQHNTWKNTIQWRYCGDISLWNKTGVLPALCKCCSTYVQAVWHTMPLCNRLCSTTRWLCAEWRRQMRSRSQRYKCPCLGWSIWWKHRLDTSEHDTRIEWNDHTFLSGYWFCIAGTRECGNCKWTTSCRQSNDSSTCYRRKRLTLFFTSMKMLKLPMQTKQMGFTAFISCGRTDTMKLWLNRQ